MADIHLQNIVKIYGISKNQKKRRGIFSKEKELPAKRAVDDVTLTIPHGSFTVLVGPSGCGKTTMLRMIAGLEEITDGKIMMADIDITNLDPGDRGLAMVFQNYALYPHMTVGKYRIRPHQCQNPKIRNQGACGSRAGCRGSDRYAMRKPAKLSVDSGSVALARAIAKYQCFLMDEPLAIWMPSSEVKCVRS